MRQVFLLRLKGQSWSQERIRSKSKEEAKKTMIKTINNSEDFKIQSALPKANF